MNPGGSYEQRLRRREFHRLLLLATAVIGGGTLGLHLIEDWTFFDSFYHTIITISTVGFGEMKPLSPGGRLLTIFLIVGGLTTTYLFASLIGNSVLANFNLRTARRMQKVIDELSGHAILCGYGRLGQIVRRELERLGHDYVVIEDSMAGCDRLEREQRLYLNGDATDEQVLLRAGIERAEGLIAAIGSDAGNVFITLTARQHNAHCPIVARAEDPKTAQKLRLVGATSVVTPYDLGGRRLAQAFLRPGAVDLADLAMGHGDHPVLIQEINLAEELPDEFTTLRGLDLGNRFGLIAVAVRNGHKGELSFNPRADQKLRAQDHLLVMGQQADIDQCAKFLRCGCRI